MPKIIYNPSGRAQEFSYWAANFYNGCSGDCIYCYMKKGVMANTWSMTPTLKKSLIDVNNARRIFIKEMKANLESLMEHGLFFNFNSDPYLKETIHLNDWAIGLCCKFGIPVKSLTKQTWWVAHSLFENNPEFHLPGFTLTGCDYMEPGASSNISRLEAMKYLHSKGYKTWASIEPIVDFPVSLQMIKESKDFCYLYKIGLMSGKKYDQNELLFFIEDVYKIKGNFKIYWKDELLQLAGLKRESLNRSVQRNFKLWEL